MFERRAISRDNLFLLVILAGALAVIAVVTALARGDRGLAIPSIEDGPQPVRPVENFGGSEYFARNPELSAANRYAELSSLEAQARLLYENPELKVLGIQDTLKLTSDDSAFLSINPEVKLHQRFLEGLEK
jgi:hypothetical protein